MEYDVIIVGTGAAGLFAALHLNEKTRVLMITKEEPEKSDSYLAQGGICVLRDPQDYSSYFEDTLKAGHYENRLDSVRVMIESSPEIIRDLLDCGVEFDRNDKGTFSYTKEGAHSGRRILHHKDITGREITEKLLQTVRRRPHVTIQSHTRMVDFLIAEQPDGRQRCGGIVVSGEDGSCREIGAKAVLLATGGLGGLFQNTTNYEHITGDSFALALKYGIKLENINYIQVHPTALHTRDKGRKFLISESVRGEGAILTNEKGERFVNELLPRDVVTEAIYEEMKRGQTDHVYLSLPHMTPDQVQQRFPNIYKRCLEEGYQLGRERIPVTPAQHYLMGGIWTDTEGRTSCRGLYAAGETACNGVHGANRLASNSLLESLVFAKRAAVELQKEAIRGQAEEIIPVSKEYSAKEQIEDLHRLVLEEIKRKDEKFYVKWCNHAG